jgi:fumarate reductase flavoprotein subunit
MNQGFDTDIVVIGSGVSGLAAAIEAAIGGARVVVFEKQPSLGGTSNFFSGIFAVESDMQKEQYIAYNRDQAFKNFMEYNHWRANPALVRNLINRSANTIAWLQSFGLEFPQVTINMPDAPRTYHVVKGGGEAVVKALVDRAKEKGVVIKVASPVKRIVKGKSGPSGVVVEIEGEDIDVSCKAVIIASGGYANNKEWIKKYAGFDLGETAMAIGNTGKMGDGIRMAWEMGASREGMGVLHVIRMGPYGAEFPFMNIVEAAAIQPVLWVNPTGERFCDEGIAFYDTSTGNINTRFKKGYSFSIFDDHIKEHFMEKGVFRGMGLGCLPGWKLRDLDAQIHHLLSLSSQEFVGSDSLDGLAAKMEVDPSVLKSTIDQYNGYCAAGYDEQFAKDPQYLLPLIGPRYYAVRARTGFLGTLGGVRINAHCEAVDQYDTPIGGIYAVGLDAGGLHTESYSMRDTSGIASAFALITGRVAGENAAQFINKRPSL